jgi:methionyl-tRNA formyltransferase
VRIFLVSTLLPVVGPLTERLRELGNEPVVWLAPRRRPEWPTPDFPNANDEVAPHGLDVLLITRKRAIEPLVCAYRPDLLLCWAFPWKIPLAALEVPRFGSVNMHPGRLPRHRGPVPLAWALRDGDSHFGITWNRMDAEFDTGPILAETGVSIEDDDCTIEQVSPKLLAAALGLLPTVLERVRAGDPGDSQPDGSADWAGHFDVDYATIDLSQPAQQVHNQVRAWHFTFGLGSVPGPILELNGRRMRVLRTSLRDPGRPALRVAAGDGPLWIVESEELGR